LDECLKIYSTGTVSYCGMVSFQVAQIYKDASVGNPVSVAVVKVEILKVRHELRTVWRCLERVKFTAWSS